VDCVADQPDCVPTPDRASFAGKRPDSRRDLAGNYVVIAVRRGTCVLMAHFRQGSLRVKPGARVRKGQYLAQVGNSGNTTGPHLHIEVLDGPPDLALLGTTRLQQSGLPFGFRDVLRRRGDKVEYLRRAVPEEGDVLSVVPPVAAPG